MSRVVSFQAVEKKVPVVALPEGGGVAPEIRTAPAERDLRIDFMRGAVMFILLTIHVEYFSWLNLFTWERVGIVSGGEGFVILAGVVLGMVYSRRFARDGMRASLTKLWDRAVQLYRVNVVIVAAVFLLSVAVPFLDLSEIMTFTDRGSGTTYQLFPAPNTPLVSVAGRILLLRAGPHQVQILGLYVVLLMITPVLLWLMNAGKTRSLLLFSWILYFYNAAGSIMPTHAQFEYAFPLLTWQLIFVHGLAVGFHKEKLTEWMEGPWRKPVLAAAAIVAAAGFFLAQNNPNPALPGWAHINVIGADSFRAFYGAYCQKNSLGLFRLLNYAAILTVGYVILGRGWKFFNRALGWLLIPIGQASLYVFIVHLGIILAASAVMPFGFRKDPLSITLATLIHIGAILAAWTMVKTKFLFRWIPR